MKKLILKSVERSLTMLSKQFTLTSCTGFCHRPEIPQELLKK